MDTALAKKLMPGDKVIIHGETEATINDEQGFDGKLYFFEVDIPRWHWLPPYSNEEIEPACDDCAAAWMQREDQR